MKVLLVHGRYRSQGGEEVVVDAECSMLERGGVEVLRYERDNHELDDRSRGSAAATAIWSRHARRAVAALVREHDIDVVHCHNTFPLLSPSVYGGARRAGAAIVQTLHNYRLTCVNALLLRDELPCTDCVGRRIAWPGVRHGCYHDSRSQSAVVATMLAAHRARGTFNRDVDAYVALTEFGRALMIRAGLPGDRIHVKPNAVRPDLPNLDQEPIALGDDPDPYLLFVGRIAREKGIELLADAWRRIRDDVGVRLVVAGSGPLEPVLEQLAAEQPGRVQLHGMLEPGAVAALMRRAQALVMPSTWYETFGMTATESLACGRPVVAPAHGALGEIVLDGSTGWHFTPNDPVDLARALRAVVGDPAECDRRGRLGRETYLDRFTSTHNLAELLSIYDSALRQRGTLA